jgi:hypothetical protein
MRPRAIHEHETRIAARPRAKTNARPPGRIARFIPPRYRFPIRNMFDNLEPADEVRHRCHTEAGCGLRAELYRIRGMESACGAIRSPLKTIIKNILNYIIIIGCIIIDLIQDVVQKPALNPVVDCLIGEIETIRA